MRRPTYDRIVSKTVDGEVIRYGILFGNEQIVFIKTGADGDIGGSEDKYPRMAHRVHERLGATVICASNPYIDTGHAAADKKAISLVAKKCNHTDFTLTLFGTSDGAHHILLLAGQMPEARRLIGVNTSMIDLDELCERLRDIPHVQKILVFGDRDELYPCVHQLAEKCIPATEIITVPNADHKFTDMIDEFISIIDLV